MMDGIKKVIAGIKKVIAGLDFLIRTITFPIVSMDFTHDPDAALAAPCAESVHKVSVHTLRIVSWARSRARTPHHRQHDPWAAAGHQSARKVRGKYGRVYFLRPKQQWRRRQTQHS